jgi:zinc/manganese transport system substrate-binding protein
MKIGFLAALAVVGMFGAQAYAAEPVNVLAAENFYGDLAQQIGGAHVKVSSILANPDADPHLFETSPSTARDVVGAAVIIYNGADYDPWMEKLLAASPRPERTTIVAAELIGAKAGDNPHLWYKPETFPAVAKALAQELEKRDPADTAEFEANLAKFNAALQPVAEGIAAIKAKHAGEKVTASEPVFGYMAEAMGLDMLNTEFQTAVMNEAEPSPSQVAAFEKSLTDGEAKVLFYNSQVTDDTTERLKKLAGDHGVAIVGVTETEPAGQKIASWLKGQVDAVAKALGE